MARSGRPTLAQRWLNHLLLALVGLQAQKWANLTSWTTGRHCFDFIGSSRFVYETSTWHDLTWFDGILDITWHLLRRTLSSRNSLWPKEAAMAEQRCQVKRLREEQDCVGAMQATPQLSTVCAVCVNNEQLLFSLYLFFARTYPWEICGPLCPFLDSFDPFTDWTKQYSARLQQHVRAMNALLCCAVFALQFFHEPLNTAAVLVELRSVLEALVSWREQNSTCQFEPLHWSYAHMISHDILHIIINFTYYCNIIIIILSLI